MACSVNYNAASIREVADNVMVHGEGPFWDSENNVLYFVDISQHRVYRLFQNRLDHVELGTPTLYLFFFSNRLNSTNVII